MKSFVNFLAGVVLGALVGAGAALLLTPESGADLRRDLRREVDDILDEGRRSAQRRRSELEAQLAQMRRPQ
jgi:gas vesicle protein